MYLPILNILEKYLCIIIMDISHIFFLFHDPDNVTLIGELTEEYHNYFSQEVLYETPAGPCHYLTLVHSVTSSMINSSLVSK